MRKLKITPQTAWHAFDDDLKVEVRRPTAREIFEILDGTQVGRLLGWADNDGDELIATVPAREIYDLFDQVIERLVIEWSITDESDAPVPVSVEAAQILTTETPAFMPWIVQEVFLSLCGVEAQIEHEKKG